MAGEDFKVGKMPQKGNDFQKLNQINIPAGKEDKAKAAEKAKARKIDAEIRELYKRKSDKTFVPFKTEEGEQKFIDEQLNKKQDEYNKISTDSFFA